MNHRAYYTGYGDGAKLEFVVYIKPMANRVPLMVTGLSGLLGTRFKQKFQSRYGFENLDLSEGIDVTKPDQVESKVGTADAKVIIHLAAFTDVTAASLQTGDEAGWCYRINVEGTKNIVAAAQKHNKYLIHISTDYVFDGRKNTEYTETDEPNPIEWYGQTKFMAEKIVQDGLDDWVILRLAYPYQAKPARPDFLAKIKDKLTTNTLPPAFIDHYLTPTWADDIAAVLSLCVTRQPRGIYHVVGSSWHTDYEMAVLIKQTFGLPGKVEPGTLTAYLKTRPRPYQRCLKISNQKIKSDLGVAMVDLAQGLLRVKKQQNEI